MRLIENRLLTKGRKNMHALPMVACTLARTIITCLRGFVITMLALVALASCSSDPQWADPEAHEKTEQLREQYVPVIAGTWHVEYVNDKSRFFERLTFFAEQSGKAERSEDGTLTGMRKWQTRELVTIDGKEQYTDWQDIIDFSGTFTGKWRLSWERDADVVPGTDRLWLSADFDDGREWMAYSLNASFIHADETTLSFIGGFVPNGNDGATVYTRGDAEPGF